MRFRKFTVGSLGLMAALSVLAAADVGKPAIGVASVYAPGQFSIAKFAGGQYLHIMQGPTATLDDLEMHVTRLEPGAASHPPHRHMHEEMLIVDQGTLEALINGEWKKVGPGAVVLVASNVLHGFRNAGGAVAQYHVVSWHTDKTPKE